MKMLNQVRQSDAPTDVHQGWSNKFKVSAVAAAITSLICTSVPTYAADLEIYKVPEDSVGTTTLMMMLDLSGSMGYGVGYSNTSMSIQEDYNVCVGSRDNVKTDSTTTSYYSRYYCEVPANTNNQKVTGYWYPNATDPERKWVTGCEKQSNNSYRCYDRLTRLKDGLRQVLEGTATVPRVDDRIIMGLATFAGSNGFVRVPARPLDEVIRSYKVMETYWEDEEYQEEVVVGSTTEPYTYAKPRWRRYTNTTPAKTCSWWEFWCTPVAASTKTYYQTCTWNVTNSTCSWSNATESSPIPSPNPFSANVNICTQGNNNDCREFYEDATGTKEVPVKEWQTKTRQVQKQREVTKNVTQRDLLLETIKDLQASGGTPTPYAYAEAAAYLLGTNTSIGDYSIRYYQTLGNRRTNGTNNYPCKAGNSATDDYRQYMKSDGTPITIRWCESENRSWTPSGTSLIYGRFDGYDRELFYNTNSPLTATASNGATYSGFSTSVTDSKSGSNYAAPVSITSQKTNTAKRECSGQGIYFLTDGQPQPNGWAVGDDGKSGTAYALMKQALGTTNGNNFSCSASPLGNRSGYDRPENGWACVGKLAQALLDPTQNPTGLKIQTAVVGFGSSFGAGGTETDDVKDAKDWGVVGNGGWFAGSSPEDVSNSINKFIKDLNKDIPSMSTGSSTIPIDSLNPEIIQPYAYFPQFEPKVNPVEKQQLWFGNLKKYYVINNGVYSSATGGAANTVVKESKLQDLTDIWANSSITYADGTAIFRKGGALSRLLLGTQTTTNDKGETEINTGRKILTEYTYDGTKAADEQISRDFDLTRINYTYTTDAKTKTDDASRVRGLMALLGYQIGSDTDTNGLNLTNVEATLRQMGSIYHSLPVLLTQEGKAEATKNATTKKIEISTTERKDYVMFGTTQGLLSVVDAVTGAEKFAFVPKEMIENQSETFKENAGSLAGGKDALYYGMDGEWVAHSVYVTKPDGTLTVKGTVRNMIGGTDTDKENLQGKQWVYGGMRMGGRSYYALDLTDIDNPKLKFHIDPATGKVYSAAHPSGKDFAAISNMAQSWSKPKLDYVNWKGQRTLVMFVGGGYDAGGTNGDGTWANGIRTGYAGYEHYNYQQTNQKGAGVYMFDADTGDLLWNASSSNNEDLKYSVASEIKTVDRNNDGIVDHIYFGDLAGQAFRADFLNDGADSFSAQVSKILDVHQTDGTSPRFYLPPTFTAHHSAGKKEGANVVVASFVSGNKSSPLLATTDSPAITGKKDSLGLQYDAVYAVYDHDIHPDGTFYPTASAAKTLAETTATTASINQLKYISNASITRSDTDATLVKGASTVWGGWYYRFDKKFSATGTDRADASQSIIKGLSPLIAMEGSLYVAMYDASNNGTSSSCGAGVKGHTFVQRLCLPTGVCPEDANYMYNLGSGIVAADVGSVDGGNTKALVVPDPADIGVGCVGAACGTGSKFITSGGPMRFIPNRWYERYAAEK